MKTMLNNLQLLHTFQDENYAYHGVTTFGIEIFVIRRGMKQVYSSYNFINTKTIAAPELSTPYSLTACEQNNCLYISDERLQHIHRVNLSNVVVYKWPVNGQPYGISVTRNNLLLVTINNLNTNNLLLVTINNLNKLREYTTEGVLQREISLDASITNIRHSILLPDGNFVVDHTTGMDMAGTQRVCIVNASGSIIHQYGGATENLITPCGMAVDKDGYIYVCDSRSCTVRILNPMLRYLGDIPAVQRQLFNRLCGLHLDESNERLYIGEQGGRRIFVLSTAAAGSNNYVTEIISVLNEDTELGIGKRY